jgi:hypothetical protein
VTKNDFAKGGTNLRRAKHLIGGKYPREWKSKDLVAATNAAETDRTATPKAAD